MFGVIKIFVSWFFGNGKSKNTGAFFQRYLIILASYRYNPFLRCVVAYHYGDPDDFC